jgi:hypothetical protein
VGFHATWKNESEVIARIYGRARWSRGLPLVHRSRMRTEGAQRDRAIARAIPHVPRGTPVAIGLLAFLEDATKCEKSAYPSSFP